MAWRKPAFAPLLGAMPTVSLKMRSCAKCRSDSVSHLVVNGKSGKRYMAIIATPKVVMPSMLFQQLVTWQIVQDSCSTHMNNHRQPAKPCTSSRELKVAAAIRPENAVAMMLPE